MAEDHQFNNRPEISAKAAIGILISHRDPQAPRIIFEKNPDTSIVPASITKLLTALTAIKITTRFNLGMSQECVVGTSDDVSGSGRNLKPGDRLTLRACLANLLITSSNVTANVIARTCGGLATQAQALGDNDAIEHFVQEMNHVAQSLKMHNSCFQNPHGLAARGQRSTARELAMLLSACLDDPILAQLISTDAYTIDIIGPDERKIDLTSVFKSSTKKIVPNFSVPQLRGGKTGSLWPSYFNIAAVSQLTSSHSLISVTCGSPSPLDRYIDYLQLVSVGNLQAPPPA